jgi:hypothetical protein
MGKKQEYLEHIPESGFVRLSKEKTPLPASQKSALIRKGNEFFNRGQYELAKRVFITTGYSDGLIRIGDYYHKNKHHLDALRMYMIAPAPDRVETITEKMAAVLRRWLKDDAQ